MVKKVRRSSKPTSTKGVMKVGKRYMATKKGYYVRKTKTGAYVYTKISRSAPADRRKKAKTKVKSGYGHRGDQKRR